MYYKMILSFDEFKSTFLFHTYMKSTDYFKALSEDIDFFAKQNNKAAEIFNKSNKNH